MARGGLFLSWSRPSPEQQKACISSAGDFNYPSDFHCATSNSDQQTEKHKALSTNGFHINCARILLGSGPDTFRIAKSALLSWRHFSLGWAMVNPDTPVKKEARFCVCVKELVPWLMMPLQIAYVTNSVKGPTKGSFSFGSGTLQGHLLAGEERFSVLWDENDKVWFEIFSFSKPAHILSVIGYPYVLLRQKYFAQQSTQAVLNFLAVGIFSILLVLARAQEAIPLFVFGDSLADNGNNNNLSAPIKYKANFPHNGVDFPGSIATGRFSNGFNSIDYIAKSLGYVMGPPAYFSLMMPNQMLDGVNFASGGSGIQDTTGPGTINMKEQIKNFKEVAQVLEQTLGRKQAKHKITTSIFKIITGSNDMFEYYYATGAANTTLNEQFVNNLVDMFTQHLTSLYHLGARHFDISGTGQLGCVPYLTSQNPSGTCIQPLNQLSEQYNAAASVKLHQLSLKHLGMRYSYSNIYHMTSHIKKNPILFGMIDTQNACCGGGKFNGEVQCTPEATYCSNRTDHVFWDWFHPTEAFYKTLSHLSLFGSPTFTTPINIHQLATGIPLQTLAES